MIIANSTPFPGGFQLELIYPDKQPSQYAKVPTEAAGLRLVYFHNRKYITEKLSSWIRQRMYAKGATPRMITAEAAQLLVVLGYHKESGLQGLCKLITDHKTALQAIAPPATSRCYGYYERVVVPIINFCEDYNK